MDPGVPFEDDFDSTIVRPHEAPSEPLQQDAVGHYLVAVEGDAPGRRVEVGGEPITIGRSAGQALAFTGDSELSRQHARLSRVGRELVVEDLRSTNGTFVNAQRIAEPTTLREGDVLRVGHQRFTYERRSRREVEQARALERDLLKASHYVKSMLPAPSHENAVRTDWCFMPSAQLGGDAFGYDWLAPGTFAFYVMDVSGHGVGAAMHSVSVMNVLRQRALPNVDFANPSEVLSSLNDRFQMDSHDGMYFTIWYGVYRTSDRTLSYSAAGHHPAFLVPSDRTTALPLGEPALMIGAMSDQDYPRCQATVPPGSVLYLFSDGVFEIVAQDERQWSLADFLPLMLAAPEPDLTEPERLYRLVRAAARPGLLDDDFSLLALAFE